jgi:hypothetical protein
MGSSTKVRESFDAASVGLCAGGQSACWYTALLAFSSLWCGGLDIGICLRDGFIWCLAFL